MTPAYFPILKAKDAEFKALSKAEHSVRNAMIPLFDIPKFNPDLKCYQDSPNPKATFLEKLGESIKTVWAGKVLMFDSFHWQNPGERTETGEHHLPYLHETLKANGMSPVPVIGYDRWDDEEYRAGLKTIFKSHQGLACLRLDRYAFDDAKEPEYFQERLTEIIDELELNPSKCHVILDYQDLSTSTLVGVLEKFDTLYPQLLGFKFATYSIAGCSLPGSIDKVVKKQDSSGFVRRIEMLLWKAVRDQYTQVPIFFGDYGVRGPSTGETGFGNTNAKIRYTVKERYYVVRGHVIRKPIGGYQHCALARKLVESGEYMSPSFSWGDKRIMECANESFGGGPTQWIEIDSSHHFAYAVSEVRDYERELEIKSKIAKTNNGT